MTCDEPRVDRALDQRVAAAPAVRVRVVVGLVAQQHALRVRGAVLRSRMICGLASKTCMPSYGGTCASNSPRESTGHDDLDAGRVGDDLVLLTEGGRDVHDARCRPRW